MEPLGSGSTSVMFSLTLKPGREKHYEESKETFRTMPAKRMKCAKYVSSAGGDGDADDDDDGMAMMVMIMKRKVMSSRGRSCQLIKATTVMIM